MKFERIYSGHRTEQEPPAYVRDAAERVAPMLAPGRVNVLWMPEVAGAMLSYGVARVNPAWYVTIET